VRPFKEDLQRPTAQAARSHYFAEAIRLRDELKQAKTASEFVRLKKRLCELLVLAWPSAIVCRSDIHLFSGGLLHPRTQANRDSSQLGIVPKFSTKGRRVFYLTVDVAQFVVDQICE